jgi:uncharacterized protein YbjQ (UPF0145 family)
MKSKDVCRKFGLDGAAFDKWLVNSGALYKTGPLGGIVIEEGQSIEAIVDAFRVHYEHLQEAERLAEAERRRLALEAEAAQNAAEREKKLALASMLITSGFSFDGYTITRYSGYISGDDAVQIDRGRQSWFGSTTADVGQSLMASLVHIRRNALAELKEAAHALGCNAVIGVDFDYLTLDPETVNAQGGTLYLPYVFGVTANGNAVIIEKS